MFATRGGARIGWVNASWPLATLEVSAERLRLRVFLLGTYDFAPGEVIALARYKLLPFFASGIRIVHAKADYPAKIVLWAPSDSDALIDRIREGGFAGAAPAKAMQ